MDDRRFDSLARGFAGGHSRRRFFRAAALGGLGWLGLRVRDAAAEPTEDNCQKTPGGHCTQHIECCDGTCENGHCPCAFKQTFCAGKCVDDSEFLTNPYNCGSCGHQCPKDAICVNGKCPCPEGTSECSGACFLLGSSNEHCGACGEACSPDRSCCDGLCFALRTDTKNCGECGRTCAEGEICVSGTCHLPKLADCLNECGDVVTVDLHSNDLHCGACGRACSKYEVCKNGVCLSGAIGIEPPPCVRYEVEETRPPDGYTPTPRP